MKFTHFNLIEISEIFVYIQKQKTQLVITMVKLSCNKLGNTLIKIKNTLSVNDFYLKTSKDQFKFICRIE